MKKTLKWILILILIPVLGFAGFLIYMTVMDFKPAPTNFEAIKGTGEKLPEDKDEFTFMIWNIGYAGLGEESDFFFDGGEGVRQSEEITQKNLKGIIDFITRNDSIDFFLLQEVDFESKRSYYVNQKIEIEKALGKHISSGTANYSSKFVPQPLLNPYGKCYAGLQSITPFLPFSARRIALTPDADWPVGLFMLDRCLLEWRFKLANQKELVVYNLHLSAYDDGTVKQSQMDTLKNVVLREFKKGNYVVAGGDWNQSPPNYHSPNPGLKATVEMNVPENFPEEGWKWAFNTSFPTNRKLNEKYTAGKTGVDVIDFYLLSPNISLIETKVINLDFKYSDHQPVYMKIQIPDIKSYLSQPKDTIPDSTSIRKEKIKQKLQGK
jgi:endonuclease/exonuclease/phosphatase family metal-dependent hydrolase